MFTTPTEFRSLFVSSLFLFLLPGCALGAADKLPMETAGAMHWLGGDAKAVQGKTPGRDALIKAAGEALAKHAGELGIDPENLPEPATVHAGKHGPNVVTYRQSIDRIDVSGTRISVVLDDAPSVRAITGRFHPQVQPATAFKLDAAAALNTLLKNSVANESARLETLDSRDGYRYFRVDSKTFHATRPARVKPVLFPAENRLVAAYYIELTGYNTATRRTEGWGSIISAEDGRLLRHDNLIREAAHSYRVFTDAAGTPLVDANGNTFPHPTASADGWLPGPPALMQLITLDHAGLSTADPWLPAGATHTVGNNVDAFFNSLIADGSVWSWEGDDPVINPAEGDFRAPLTAAATFDYPYDATITAGDYFQIAGDPVTPVPGASTQLNAKIVQAFYASNWLHDLFYDLGFDEAAGNAQHDNFGRGGLDGDRLVVDAGFGGTYVYSPEDGESPHMRLGRNGFSGTSRDASGFDFPVIVHEWMHVLFERLTMPGSSAQFGAMHEGTADFVGAFLTVQESHRDAAPYSGPYNGTYALGAYNNLDYDFPWDTLPAAGASGHPDNTYYHGIRRFPYSADLTRNPLTLRHMAYGEALPAGYTPFDWKFRSLVNAEVHSAGEVWASALWQCARNLLADETRFTFEVRKRRMLAYLVAGLKLFPADPDFIEARNAVLFAMRAADTTDYELCRQGFATRGFGAGALAPELAAAGNIGVKENFSTNDAALTFIDWQLQETAGGDGDGVLDVGENGEITVTVKNTGLVPLDDVRIYIPALAWAYAFPSGSTASGIALQPNEEFTTSFGVNIVTDEGAPMLLFNLTATDLVRTDIYGQQDALFTVNYDMQRDSTTDWLISQQAFDADWTAGADLSGYTHGCAGGCYGDIENWQRVTHLGEFAYRIGSEHVSLDAHLATVPFTLYPAAPFRIVMKHDHDFGSSGAGMIEISVAGGPWQDIAPWLSAGNSTFHGSSSGWQMETVDLGTAFGGQTVQLRWRINTGESFDAQPVHWALARISIQGASTPMFSNMHIDVD
ncbi:MAG TPA: M36 family metallopeptidase [Gammaproteobacteria bacterium]